MSKDKAFKVVLKGEPFKSKQEAYAKFAVLYTAQHEPEDILWLPFTKEKLESQATVGKSMLSNVSEQIKDELVEWFDSLNIKFDYSVVQI
jgi:hypothetical protein